MSETRWAVSQQLSAPERQVLSVNSINDEKRSTAAPSTVYHRGSASGSHCLRLTAHPRGAAYESAVRVSRAAYETNVFQQCQSVSNRCIHSV